MTCARRRRGRCSGSTTSGVSPVSALSSRRRRPAAPSVAPQRGEHGEEERGQQGEDRVLERFGRARAFGGTAACATCSSSPGHRGHAQLAEPVAQRADLLRAGVRCARRVGPSRAPLRSAPAAGDRRRGAGRGTSPRRRWRSPRRRLDRRRCLQLHQAGDVVDRRADLVPQRGERLAGQLVAGAPRVRRGRSAARASSPAAASRSPASAAARRSILDDQAGRRRVGLRERQRQHKYSRGHRDDDEDDQPPAAADGREVARERPSVARRRPAETPATIPLSRARSMMDEHSPLARVENRPGETT